MMVRRTVRLVAGAGAVSIALALGAAAQTSPKQPHDPNLPPSRVPEKLQGPPDDATGSTKSLSEELEKNDGVIKPPDTGAGGVIRPPDTGTTPVIPPPGSPGSRAPNADPR